MPDFYYWFVVGKIADSVSSLSGDLKKVLLPNGKIPKVLFAFIYCLFISIHSKYEGHIIQKHPIGEDPVEGVGQRAMVSVNVNVSYSRELCLETSYMKKTIKAPQSQGLDLPLALW